VDTKSTQLLRRYRYMFVNSEEPICFCLRVLSFFVKVVMYSGVVRVQCTMSINVLMKIVYPVAGQWLSGLYEQKFELYFEYAYGSITSYWFIANVCFFFIGFSLRRLRFYLLLYLLFTHANASWIDETRFIKDIRQQF